MSNQLDSLFYLVFHLNALECNALKYYFAHGVIKQWVLYQLGNKAKCICCWGS